MFFGRGMGIVIIKFLHIMPLHTDSAAGAVSPVKAGVVQKFIALFNSHFNILK
jgi:hypothetical protein